MSYPARAEGLVNRKTCSIGNGLSSIKPSPNLNLDSDASLLSSQMPVTCFLWSSKFSINLVLTPFSNISSWRSSQENGQYST